jgi:hypothetical protein
LVILNWLSEHRFAPVVTCHIALIHGQIFVKQKRIGDFLPAGQSFSDKKMKHFNKLHYYPGSCAGLGDG